ncbi:SGNH/GDSL hydrolase family protein [Amycolatopsis sp. FBCC-B4732]|uniref:SGNH/GDSL hydrolase family protein n=1 Tax=Amycolatopsis sp. FBCC-B4732 TaxID=3079339 RepID=UPI001FF602F0|nr:SGNH/GDSL hydrolase family protein [Amycolatopsis sp. FBCC-B4732]UOX91826.1 SGNH/GDSL hydrolase family protein [Amycolatopsis sp. FBCC-B4732]
MRRTSLIAVLALLTALFVGASGRPPSSHWVATWTSMPQLTEPGNLPPAPYTGTDRVLDNASLRQTAHVTAGGPRIRLRFSNAFGGAPLPLTAVTVARPVAGAAGGSAVVSGSAVPVTFHGKAGTVVPVGAQVVSDPLPFPVRPFENVAVTTYLAHGQASLSVTSHPGSRTTSYLVPGDQVAAPELPGATPVDHWYFLSGVEVLSPASAVAVIGDSLSDGRGSTTNGNDRWPDVLASRVPSAVLNQAAGGNRVLQDGLGPNVLARLDRDLLAQSGVSRAIVFEGVNDLGTATPAAAADVAAQLIDAYDQILVRAHAAGIEVYGATLTPFGGNTGYDAPEREAARQQVNAWIRDPGHFDAVLDFDRVARDPAAPARLLPAYDVGDHLHLNPAGYRALGSSVPARLFRTD